MQPGSNQVGIDVDWGGATANTSAAQPIAAPAAVAAPSGVAAAPSSLKVYSKEEVAKHNTEEDCWVVIKGNVYDITKFLPDHPGGRRAPVLASGGDAAQQFLSFHPPEFLTKYAAKYRTGSMAP